jgi:hypothetical protein
MRLIHPLTAAALFAIPTIALAQGMDRDQPGSSPAAPPSSGAGSYGAGASTSATAPSTGAAASVTAGLPVKDKTGATIGSVAAVKTDASGKQVATIRMGADSFAVDASALAVDKGAAVINATQAEIKSMLPKGKQ